MFLRCNRRKKDGKTHEYWSVVEKRRCSDGRVVQRQVLYLGEINASQREAWRKTIELQDAGRRRQVALFPAGSMPVDDVDAIGVRLSELRLRRPRQLLAPEVRPCAGQYAVAEGAQDAGGLPPHRPGLGMATAPPVVRRQRDGRPAGLGLFALAEKNTLYRCLDRLLEHKDDLFKFLLG
jgi:hypothetical protein